MTGKMRAKLSKLNLIHSDLKLMIHVIQFQQFTEYHLQKTNKKTGRCFFFWVKFRSAFRKRKWKTKSTKQWNYDQKSLHSIIVNRCEQKVNFKFTKYNYVESLERCWRLKSALFSLSTIFLIVKCPLSSGWHLNIEIDKHYNFFDWFYYDFAISLSLLLRAVGNLQMKWWQFQEMSTTLTTISVNCSKWF